MASLPLKKYAKSLAFSVLGARCIAKGRIALRKKKVTVLCMHRVGQPDETPYAPLAVNIFEELIVFIKENFQVLKISEIGMPTNDPRPKLVLSFDDGYADFKSTILPILIRNGLPVNLNIIPDCLVRNEPPINIRIMEILRQKSEAGEYQHLKMLMPNLPREFNEMSNHKMLMSMNMREIIKFEVKLKSFVRDSMDSIKMLSIEDVRGLPESVEVGCHSYEHACMTREDESYFCDDIKKCVQFFQSEKLTIPKVYCFPYGQQNDRQVEIALKNGFDQVLIVDNKYYGGGACVSRLELHAESISEAIFRVSGGLAKS